VEKRVQNREEGDWSLSAAFPIWLVASVAGWVAVAGFLLATAGIDEHSAATIEGAFRELARVATAIGPLRP